MKYLKIYEETGTNNLPKSGTNNSMAMIYSSKLGIKEHLTLQQYLMEKTYPQKSNGNPPELSVFDAEHNSFFEIDDEKGVWYTFTEFHFINKVEFLNIGKIIQYV